MPLKITGSDDMPKVQWAIREAIKCFESADMDARECYDEHTCMLEGAVFDAEKAGFWQYTECRALSPFQDFEGIYLTFED
jgi:hypothetical protein